MAFIPTPGGAFTLANLAALEAAMLTGTRSVAYDGKSVTYRDLAEMMDLWRLMRLVLGLDPSKKTVLVSHDRGFGPGFSDVGFSDDNQNF